MKKVIATFLTLILCHYHVNSQQLIEGYVLSAKDAPIAGVNVLLSQTSVATVTNYDGYFKLPMEGKADKAKLIIRLIGYAPLDAEIDIERGYKYKLKIHLVKAKRARKSIRSSFSIEKDKISNN
jgi:hypothetical protein